MLNKAQAVAVRPGPFDIVLEDPNISVMDLVAEVWFLNTGSMLFLCYTNRCFMIGLTKRYYYNVQREEVESSAYLDLWL